MFERYTEKARRVVFFARYEASHFGDERIRDTHLLLGLLRENEELFARVLLRGGSADSEKVHDRINDLRRNLEDAIGPPRPAVPTKVDMPLTDTAKGILAHAAEEAATMAHRHIGAEHLLLGILRERKCIAASILQNIGIELATAREAVAALAAGGMFTVDVPTEQGGRSVVSSRRHTGTLEFVCDGKVISSVVVSAEPSVPRIGERVVLKSKEGMDNSYRVEDVRWVYERFPPDMVVAPHRLTKVIIQLKPA